MFRYVRAIVAVEWKHGLLEELFERGSREVCDANGLRTGFLS